MELTFDEQNQILDTKVGDLSFRDMTAITFNQYCLKKVGGMQTYNPKLQIFILSCQAVLPSRLMTDEEKLDKLHKIKEMGISIP